MEAISKIPFYAKVALIFVGLFAFVYTLYIGQHIFIPLLYATILAILLNPIVNFLIARKINKILAIIFALVIGVGAMIGIFYIVSSQLSIFYDTYPQLKLKFAQTSNDLLLWTSEKFHIRQGSITKWLDENRLILIENIGVTDKISAAGRMLFVGMLIPVYIFMILFYKPLLIEFIRKLFRKEHQTSVAEVLSGTKTVIQSYLTGLFFEMLIMSVLNSLGLILLGIPYAIILGITGAILNIVPYIGGIIAIALPMIIAFVTKDSTTYPLLVLVIYLFIQFVDNHFIIPNVVAKRVKINALVSIIVVLVGGALFGVAGMFLSIPLTAILKIIFDHIEGLKPWGFLLGNIVPSATKYSFPVKKKK
ncbi:MAG TPA: AI-2E family transporter [Bacteroidia bacterium]|nr:AI-2E family transporter [Bacteroidia bacterium]